MTREEAESRLIRCEKFKCRMLPEACEKLQIAALKDWTAARSTGVSGTLPKKSTTLEVLSACGHCERRLASWPEDIDRTILEIHQECIRFITFDEKEDTYNAVERRECRDPITLESRDREGDSLVPGEESTRKSSRGVQETGE